MSDVSIGNDLITEHIDIWTSTVKTKSASGRGSSKKIDLYGIKKLRELILELAVRGKLVPQDPSDEPASKLLERIAAEKAQLVKEKKIKKPKALPEISEEEKPFELPEGWEWSRVSDVTSFINGYAFKSSSFKSDGVGIVKIGDISSHGVLTPNTMSRVNIEVIQDLDENLKVIKGDLVIAMSGATTGKLGFNYSDETFYLNQRVGKFIPYQVSIEYLFLPLTTKISENLAKSLGSAIPNISTGQINEIVLALPPLQEQHRIVAKVDELMALCDQLEQQTESQIEAQQTLVSVLLETLTASKDHNELMQNWQRLSEHFDTLFTTEQSIDQLKQTILQLAVMGRLVPQDPTNEPASKLLERIAAEKAQLIADKKIKKQKALPPISDDEKPFELPEGWEWCRLSDAIDVRDGTHDSPKDAIGTNTFPLITSKNFDNGRIDFDNARQISPADHIEISKRSQVDKLDILFSMIGGNIGNQVIVVDDRPFSIKNVALFKYFNKSFTIPYFVFLYTQNLATNLQEKAIGGAQPFISLGALRSLIFALPPVEEQHRIVAKVDELMAICDQLKTKLNQSQQTQLHLTDAIVEQVV